MPQIGLQAKEKMNALLGDPTDIQTGTQKKIKFKIVCIPCSK
jgi:hypothetical protein